MVVVILDKDPFFREFQRVLLEKNGYKVVTPTQPEEFNADHVAGLGPELVITEVLLPGADGLELVRRLREHPGVGDCKIVVFSVLHAEGRALAAGADRFVRKPLMQQPYMSAVMEMMKKEASEATQWTQSRR